VVTVRMRVVARIGIEETGVHRLVTHTHSLFFLSSFSLSLSLSLSQVDNIWVTLTSYAYQRHVLGPHHHPHDLTTPQGSGCEYLCEEGATDEQIAALADALRVEIYPSSQGYRSEVQKVIGEAVLKMDHDIVCVGGCGVGKTFPLLLAAKRCAALGRVTVVISPQRNVTIALCEQLKRCDISVRIWTGTSPGDIELASTPTFNTGPPFSVLLFSIDVLASSDFQRYAWSLIDALATSGRLPLVFIDELHLHLSSPSFRGCFGRAGSLRARVAKGVRFMLSTGTLAVGTEEIVRHQLALAHTTEFIRDDTPIGLKSALIVEHCSGQQACEARLFAILGEWVKSPAAEARGSSRVLIMVTSRATAESLKAAIAAMLTKRGLEEELVGVASSDFDMEEVNRVLRDCDIIVGTSLIASAANISNLHLLIVLQSLFNLADLAQVLARLSRELGAAAGRAIFLFDGGEHSRLFGALNTAAAYEADAKAIAHCSDSDTPALRSQLAPSRVRDFAIAAKTSCATRFLNDIFVGGVAMTCCERGDDFPRCGYCGAVERGADVAVGEEDEAGAPAEDADWVGAGDNAGEHESLDHTSLLGEDHADMDTRADSGSADSGALNTGAASIADGGDELGDPEGFTDTDSTSLLDSGLVGIAMAESAALQSTSSSDKGATTLHHQAGHGSGEARFSTNPYAQVLLRSKGVSGKGIQRTTAGAAGSRSSETELAPLGGGAGDAVRKAGERIMVALHTAISVLRERPAEQVCLVCEKGCSGFRTNDGRICPAWGCDNGMICFCCGGAHSKCGWRRAGDHEFCSMCMLPWGKTLGHSFHYGGVSDMGGLERSRCRFVGDVLQAAVARIWHSPAEEWGKFVTACSRFAGGQIPGSGTGQDRVDIARFDDWLRRECVVRNGIRNWEIFILYALGVDLSKV
jgi:hypothetical protein